MKNKKYFAFISYKRENEEWAKWFQNELENYHLPSTLNGKPDIVNELPEQFRPPKGFRPVFRDIDELKAGNLPEQIYKALKDSLNLIVICSSILSDDEKAKWVNKEISDFIEIGAKEGVDNVLHIFPFIVDGIPYAGDGRECFPKVLRDLSKEQERIGGNVNEGGDVSEINRERAFVKVLAGMLSNVDFDELWNRYDRDKMERERREKEERDKLLIVQSRFLAEKANQLVDEGDSYTARLLALEALPNDKENPDRPYVAEAEAALRNACRKETTILRGFKEEVRCAQFSRDGNNIITTCGNVIQIWNTKDGTCRQELIEHSNDILSVSISNKDGLFASASKDDTIRIWRVGKEKSILTIDLRKYNDSIPSSIDFSRDGLYLVSVSFSGTIRIWNVSTGSLKTTICEGNRNVNEKVTCVAFVPDGRRVVSGGRDCVLRIWDIISRKCIKEYPGHGGGILDLAVSNDGQYVATASSDKTIRIWNISENVMNKRFKPVECLKVLEGHSEWVRSVSYNIDGNEIVSASDDGTIRIWDTETWECKIQKGHSDKVLCLAYSPNDKMIVSTSADKTVRLWDCEISQECQMRLLKKSDDFSGNGLFNYDGTLLAWMDNEQVIRIWNLYSGDCINEINTKAFVEKPISLYAFSPVCNQLISSSEGTLYIWNTDSGVCEHTFIGHEKPVNYAEFDLNGLFVASASDDRTVKIWGIKDNRCFNTIPFDNGVELSMFSPNGKELLVLDCRGMLSLIDLERKIVTKEIKIYENFRKVNSISISPDGNLVCIAYQLEANIDLWDIRNIRHSVLHGHTDWCYSTKFDNRGKYLVSCSRDGTIKVWDVNTGNCVKTFMGQRWRMYSAVFGTNGRCIISVSTDEMLRIWNFPPLQQLIDETRERFKEHQLTPEERQKYYLE